MTRPYEQTDGFEPNKQTPPPTSVLGTVSNPFTEVIGTTVSGTTVYVGAGAHQAAKVYSETVDLVAATAKNVTHSLVNANPIVQVYGSGTNQQLGFDASGNAAQARITAVSGVDGNTVAVTCSAAVLGAVVVVIG